jgi:hypothetical protein
LREEGRERTRPMCLDAAKTKIEQAEKFLTEKKRKYSSVDA